MPHLQLCCIRLDIVVIITGIWTIFCMEFVHSSQKDVVKPWTVRFLQLLVCFKQQITFTVNLELYNRKQSATRLFNVLISTCPGSCLPSNSSAKEVPRIIRNSDACLQNSLTSFSITDSLAQPRSFSIVCTWRHTCSASLAACSRYLNPLLMLRTWKRRALRFQFL